MPSVHWSRVAILGVVLLATGGLALFLPRGEQSRVSAEPAAAPLPPEQLEAYAARVVDACAGKSHRPSCYDEEIPKLMDVISMEQAFAVTHVVQRRDPEYAFCHVLGHNLSAREAAKDVSQWKNVIARCPSGMCSNGCLHGALQERFRAETLTPEELESILPDLEDVCEDRPNRTLTGLEQASCYHAVGHLLMYISGGDVKKSNDICKRVAVKTDGRNFLQVCYEGNFMQVFQPLEPEDFDLIKDIAPQDQRGALALCAGYSGMPYDACRRESWPLFHAEILTPEGLVKFCGYAEDPATQRQCYNAMFYIIPVQVNFDEERIIRMCRELPAERRGQCFANSASRFIETDYTYGERAVAFCKAAEQLSAEGGSTSGGGVEKECYDELVFFAGYNFPAGSPEQAELCRALPEPWRGKCLAGERAPIK